MEYTGYYNGVKITGAPSDVGSEGPPGKDGFSPTVETESINNGTKVTITDVNGPHSFDVMNGEQGPEGSLDDLKIDTKVMTRNLSGLSVHENLLVRVVDAESWLEMSDEEKKGLVFVELPDDVESIESYVTYINGSKIS